MKARDNPFRVARVLSAIRYEVQASDSGDSDGARLGGGQGAVSLLPRLEALRYRAALVGPHGAGKTTLLEDLEGVLRERGFRITHVRLDTDNPRLPREWRWQWRSQWGSQSRWPWRSSARRLDGRDIVCLDGAEQLGTVAWRRFRWQTRRAGGLIIATHTPGRLPTLIECTTSVGLLERIIQRLAPGTLDAALLAASVTSVALHGAPPGAAALHTMPPAAELFARHRGNIRDALRELYDVYAAARS